MLLLGACALPDNLIAPVTTQNQPDWAVGAEVFVVGQRFYNDDWSPGDIEQLTLSPPGLATASRIDDTTFAIQTLAVGTLHVHYNVQGDEGDREYAIVPASIGPLRVGTTDGGPMYSPGALLELPPVLTPRPTEIGVYTPRHVLLEDPIVDANNQMLTGHPTPSWSPLDRLSPVTWETFQTRTEFELVPDATPLAVSVGGETISFVAVEPGSATRFALIDTKTGTIYDGSTAIPAPVVQVYYYGTNLVVLAYDANDRLLIGQDPTVTAPTGKVDTVTVGPSISISGISAGTSSITVTYDGLTETFPVTTP